MCVWPHVLLICAKPLTCLLQALAVAHLPAVLPGNCPNPAVLLQHCCHQLQCRRVRRQSCYQLQQHLQPRHLLYHRCCCCCLWYVKAAVQLPAVLGRGHAVVLRAAVRPFPSMCHHLAAPAAAAGGDGALLPACKAAGKRWLLQCTADEYDVRCHSKHLLCRRFTPRLCETAKLVPAGRCCAHCRSIACPCMTSALCCASLATLQQDIWCDRYVSTTPALSGALLTLLGKYQN
jgi:hypothetical protein